ARLEVKPSLTTSAVMPSRTTSLLPPLPSQPHCVSLPGLTRHSTHTRSASWRSKRDRAGSTTLANVEQHGVGREARGLAPLFPTLSMPVSAIPGCQKCLTRGAHPAPLFYANSKYDVLRPSGHILRARCA